MSKKPKALVVSVGGTPEPIIKSISELRPDYISFYCSSSTAREATNIFDKIKGIIPENVEPNYFCSENADFLDKCFVKAEEAVKWAIEKVKNDESSVFVDYTGGTKNMVAALILAAIHYNVQYRYVAGERNRDGVGNVISGTEKIIEEGANPWDYLARYQWKIFKHLFNYGFYCGAKNLISETYSKFENELLKRLFKNLECVADAMDLWDRFNYEEAKNGINKVDCETIADIAQEILPDSKKLFEKIVPLLKRHFNILAKASKDSWSYIDETKILDLLENAKRQAGQGHYEDAIIRLYRVVEMIAQWCLLNNYKINNSKIDIDEIKDEDIKNTVKKFIDEIHKKELDNDKKTTKLGMKNSYKLLIELESTQVGKIKGKIKWGERYKQYEDEIKKLQNARNECFIVHKTNSIKKEQFDKFLIKVEEFLEPLKKDKGSKASGFTNEDIKL